MGSIKSKASSYFITKSQLQKAAGGVVEGGACSKATVDSSTMLDLSPIHAQ